MSLRQFSEGPAETKGNLFTCLSPFRMFMFNSSHLTELNCGRKVETTDCLLARFLALSFTTILPKVLSSSEHNILALPKGRKKTTPRRSPHSRYL